LDMFKDSDGGSFTPPPMLLPEDARARVVAVSTVVGAAVVLVVATVAVVVAPTATTRQGARAELLVKSAENPAMKPAIAGTATMKMMTNTSPSRQELLRGMVSTQIGMLTVVLQTISPASLRR
jgi:hypothetical protein